MPSSFARHDDTVLPMKDWSNEHKTNQEIVDQFRTIVKNNRSWLRWRLNFLVVTDETWLPTVLVQMGFFPSGNMVKKNQPELWRDIKDDEVVKLSWAQIRVIKLPFLGEWVDNPDDL